MNLTREQRQLIINFDNWWQKEGEEEDLLNDFERTLKSQIGSPMEQLEMSMKHQKLYHSKYIRPKVKRGVKRKREDPGIPPGFEQFYGSKR